MRGFTIRRLEHIEEVKKMLEQFGDRFESSVFETQEQVWEKAKKMSEHAVCAVAELDDEALGLIVFYANDMVSKQAYVSMFVQNKNHSRNMLGVEAMAKLTLYMFVYCQQRGFETIKLEVAKKNAYNVNLYKKIGFRVTGDASEDTLYMEMSSTGISRAIKTLQRGE